MAQPYANALPGHGPPFARPDGNWLHGTDRPYFDGASLSFASTSVEARRLLPLRVVLEGHQELADEVLGRHQQEGVIEEPVAIGVRCASGRSRSQPSVSRLKVGRHHGAGLHSAGAGGDTPVTCADGSSLSQR